MQFSFLGFSTAKIMEFKLDVKDIIILKYFNDFKNTGKMNYEIVNGEKYYWISYQNIENELPFLGLAKRAIMSRMLRMKKLGILKHYTKKDGGTFSYYALGEKFNEFLFRYLDKDAYNDKDNRNNNDSNREKINNSNDTNTDFNIDNIDNNSEGINEGNFKFINSKKSISKIDKENIKCDQNKIINRINSVNSNKESYDKNYKEDSALDELEGLFKFSNKSKSIKNSFDSDITKGIHLNKEGMNIKDYTIDNNELVSNNYDKNSKHNLQKGMIFNEFEEENAQGVVVNSDRGCALKGRTKTNILNNNKTIVTNIYNNINNKVFNNIKDIVSNVLNYLNEKVGVNYKITNTKTINLIKLRLKDGFTLEDFKIVIDKKIEGWKGTSFEQYLNPFTLFGDKFELYLNQKVIKNQDKNNNSYSNNYRQPRKLRFDNFTGRTYDYDKLEKQLLGWE